MCKERITDILHEYLKQQEDIIFGYLFGSFVGQDKFRDIDIGIYSQSPRLIALGRMQADLVQQTKEQIDLVYLNDLPDKHPAFAYQVVSTGKLLYSRNYDKQSAYKHHVFLQYFDTNYLRKQMKRAFHNVSAIINLG